MIELNRQPTHSIIQITILCIKKKKIVTKLQSPNVRALTVSQNHRTEKSKIYNYESIDNHIKILSN